MSYIDVRDTSENLVFKYGLRGQFNTHYRYLIIDDIYKLSKLANIYCKINNEYKSFNTTIAKCVYENNIIVINKLPSGLVKVISDLLQLFNRISIPEKLKRNKNDRFIYSNSFKFSLISKKLLKEKSLYKSNFTFTDIGHLAKYGEQNIKQLLNDIMLIVYDYSYSVEIVWPMIFNDKQMDDYTSKAYELVGLTI
jgi:hypothetical protein